MTNKDFCLSSYMAFRYIWDDKMNFYNGFKHHNYPPLKELCIVRTAQDIESEISRQITKLYSEHDNIGILLSGGMDSAILAAYLKPGSHAFTFFSTTGVFDADFQRAEEYCKKFDLIHHPIEISFDDYKKYTPIVMAEKSAPVHSIEPQIYKAAIEAKKLGVELLLAGDGADSIFGGLDKLMAPDWTFEDFVKRYIFLEPNLVLNNPIDQRCLFEKYRTGENSIDHLRFVHEIFATESAGSYINAFKAAKMPFVAPYVTMRMGEPLDVQRLRDGESKYLIRELYKIKYPELQIPEKIPMPRPVDSIFKNWQGPSRPEFRNDIPMGQLSGNQKWQLWCAEQFLELFD